MKLQFAQRALSEMERGNREWLARRDKNPELFEEELAGVFENIKFSRFVTNERVATASELAAHALRLGLTARRTVSGPLKFLDKNTALASFVTHLSYARADRSGLLEQQVDASLGWQWPLVRGPASGLAGPCATVGVAFQRREPSFVGETLRGGAGLLGLGGRRRSARWRLVVSALRA